MVINKSIQTSNQKVLGSTPDRSTRIFFRVCLCHLLINTSFSHNFLFIKKKLGEFGGRGGGGAEVFPLILGRANSKPVFHTHTYLSCVGPAQSSFSLLSLLCVEFACMIMYTVSKGFSHPPLNKKKVIVKNKQTGECLVLSTKFLIT